MKVTITTPSRRMSDLDNDSLGAILDDLGAALAKHMQPIAEDAPWAATIVIQETEGAVTTFRGRWVWMPDANKETT